MRRDWIKAAVICSAVYLLAMAAACGGCQDGGDRGAGVGNGTTRPALTPMEIRLGAMTEAWKGYAAAERLVIDIHRMGLGDTKLLTQTSQIFQEARAALAVAETLLIGGSDAEFQAAIAKAASLVLKAKGSTGPTSGILHRRDAEIAEKNFRFEI